MDSLVITPNEFDVSKITYNSPRILDNNGKYVYMSYEGKKLILQTPEMTVPFGLNKWDNDGKNTAKYSLDLSFKGKESREILNTFFKKLEALDAKLVDDGLTNSQLWFKKKQTNVEVVKELYTPTVKYAKDKNGDLTDKYPPTMKLTVPYDEKIKSFSCEVYNAQRCLVSLNDIETKGSRISAIIQCVGIWVAGTKFGCSWKIIQMKVTPPTTIKGYAFKELADDVVEKSIDDEDNDDMNDPKDILANAEVEDHEEEEEVVTDSDGDNDIPKVAKKASIKRT